MSCETIARAALLLAAGACAVVDLRQRRIPDAVVAPAAALIALARVVSAARGAGWLAPLEGLATAAAALLLFALVRAASGGRLGAGDAKLAALIGLALGVRGWLAAMVIASASGSAVALALIAAGRLRPSDPLPFAPFLAVGAAGALLADPILARLLSG